MNDRFIMENLLLTTKGVCDLYMHGAIESATCNVHDTFDKALNKSLCMQSGVYQILASMGCYPTLQAYQHNIDQVRQKFSGQA